MGEAPPIPGRVSTHRAFILTWNPSSERGWHGDPTAATRWSTGVRTSGIDAGDRLYLFRQGKGRRGIVAAGVATGPIEAGEGWKPAPFVPLQWRGFFLGYPIDVEVLEATAPGVAWSALRASGVQIQGPDDASAIERLVLKRIGSFG